MGTESEDVGAATKRVRILHAAREVCARRGYDGARMEEIASAARVSKGTLYNFFENKEDLFLNAVLESYERARRLLRAETRAPGGPAERLEGICAAMAKAIPIISEEMPVNFQIWGVMARDEKARQRMFEALRRIYAEQADEIQSILREGQQAGVFAAHFDPEAIVTAIHGIFDGQIYRSAFDPENANSTRLGAALEALLRHAVLPKRARLGESADG